MPAQTMMAITASMTTSFYTGEEFSVYNASASNVTAENTVWDTDPPIDVSIIDGNDNPAYGIVDYEPTLTPYAPPAGLSLSVNGQFVTIYWPNGIKYPTYLYPDAWNLYIDGSFYGTITSMFICFLIFHVVGIHLEQVMFMRIILSLQ